VDDWEVERSFLKPPPSVASSVASSFLSLPLPGNTRPETAFPNLLAAPLPPVLTHRIDSPIAARNDSPVSLSGGAQGRRVPSPAQGPRVPRKPVRSQPTTGAPARLSSALVERQEPLAEPLAGPREVDLARAERARPLPLSPAGSTAGSDVSSTGTVVRNVAAAVRSPPPASLSSNVAPFPCAVHRR